MPIVSKIIGKAAPVLAALSIVAGASAAAAADKKPVTEIRVVYLTQEIEHPPALSNLDPRLEDEGLQGARLGIEDDNTTGRFLKQRFVLDEVTVALDGDPAAALPETPSLVILDLTAEGLDRVLKAPGAADHLLFNAGAPDDRFRNADCRANLLHTLPSRSMRTDALAQYLVRKRWKDWFLVTGPRPADALFAKALERSATKFGAKVTERKDWTGEHDARRTAQAEVPLFTQGADYDVLMVADEIGDFGDYLMYRTWEPKVVAGTQGLTARAWDRVVEQWGAAQLQSRFLKLAERWMTARDYAAWAAARSVGEAATRTGSGDFAAIRDYVTGDKFELAAFKGRKLSYRDWNGQLRQPIPLVAARSLVGLSPQEGFLHQRTDMDTLGWDEPESACKAFKGE